MIELWREKCRALSVRRAALTAGVLLGVVGGICHLYRASDAAVVTVAPPVRSCAAPGEIAGLSAATQRAQTATVEGQQGLGIAVKGMDVLNQSAQDVGDAVTASASELV